MTLNSSPKYSIHLNSSFLFLDQHGGKPTDNKSIWLINPSDLIRIISKKSDSPMRIFASRDFNVLTKWQHKHVKGAQCARWTHFNDHASCINISVSLVSDSWGLSYLTIYWTTAHVADGLKFKFSIVIFINSLKYPGPWFNIKMSSYQYRKSHCGDKTILRPSYLHNGISYTAKMSSLYWIRALFAYWSSTVPVSMLLPGLHILCIKRHGMHSMQHLYNINDFLEGRF